MWRGGSRNTIALARRASCAVLGWIMPDQHDRKNGHAEGLASLLLAAAITAISVVFAWRLASTDFAAAPALTNPGTIFLATAAGSGSSEAPIDVSVTYSGAPGLRSTELSMTVTQLLPQRSVRQTSPTVIIMLCGAIDSRPRFRNEFGRKVGWHQLVLPSGQFNNLVGNGAECSYTSVSLNAESAGQEFRQAILQGSAGKRAGVISGDRILYALPGIEAWPPEFIVRSFNAGLLPSGSSAKLVLSGFPSDLENVTSSPQLPNSGFLQWSAPLSPLPHLPIYQYRLGGQLADTEATGQRDLFISGALVGVAGAGLIWFFENLIKILATIRRKKRVEPGHSRPLQGAVPAPDGNDRPQVDPPAEPSDPGPAPEHCEPAVHSAEYDFEPAEDMLDRLKTHGHGPSLQAIYDGLRDMGYKPHSPATRKPGKRPEPYIRWTDPARGGPAVIYLTSTTVRLARKDDAETLGSPPTTSTTIAGTGQDTILVSVANTGQILRAARRLKR
jgi:hypothetical protein